MSMFSTNCEQNYSSFKRKTKLKKTTQSNKINMDMVKHVKGLNIQSTEEELV